MVKCCGNLYIPTYIKGPKHAIWSALTVGVVMHRQAALQIYTASKKVQYCAKVLKFSRWSFLHISEPDILLLIKQSWGIVLQPSCMCRLNKNSTAWCSYQILTLRLIRMIQTLFVLYTVCLDILQYLTVVIVWIHM